MKPILAIFLLGLCLVSLSCRDASESGAMVPEIRSDGEIVIRDLTGKEWNITHAVNEYGMDPERFNFGLGPIAIPPITEPTFVGPGDPGYPDPGETFLVLGLTVGGESRAYPVETITRREVVNDQYAVTAAEGVIGLGAPLVTYVSGGGNDLYLPLILK